MKCIFFFETAIYCGQKLKSLLFTGPSTISSSPIEDAELKIHYGVLAYAKSLDIWGKSGKIDVIMPYANLSGTAMVGDQRRERDVPELTDPRFCFSVNFYGAPAMSLP